MTESSLEGHLAIVTGGGSGIGRATAVVLASDGATIALVDRDADGLAETERLVATAGGVASAFCFDLADTDGIPTLVSGIVTKHGVPHALVNVAGITGRWSIADTTVEAWNTMFAVNLTAPFVLIKEVGRHMVDGGRGGRIVNVTSSAAFTGVLSPVAYSCTKAGLAQLTRVAAAEFGASDINVNAVAPGLTRTPMTAHSGTTEDFDRRAVEGPLANLLGRPSEPEDIAHVIKFLCSPDSRQVTGQTVHVSAGNVFS